MRSALILLLVLCCFSEGMGQQSQATEENRKTILTPLLEFTIGFSLEKVIYDKFGVEKGNGPYLLMFPAAVGVTVTGKLIKDKGSIVGSVIGNISGVVISALVIYKNYSWSDKEEPEFLYYVFPALGATIGYSIFSGRKNSDNDVSMSFHPVYFNHHHSGRYTGLNAIIRF